MDWTLEVVIVPVSDTDIAVAFNRDQVGFTSITSPRTST